MLINEGHINNQLPYIWLNGDIMSADDYAFHANDRIVLGDAVFDTMLVSGGVPIMLSKHILRLLEHAHIAGIDASIGQDMSATESLITEAVLRIISSNNMYDGHYSIKTVLTAGRQKQRGLSLADDNNFSLLLTANKIDYKSRKKYISAIITDKFKRNNLSFLSKIKHIGYIENRIALNEALLRGFDDAILMNCENRLACASTSNIFIIRNGKMITPPQSEGAINGTIR